MNALELGVYTLTPNEVRGSNDVADVILESEVTTLELTTSSIFANLDVVYRARPETGKLWLPVRDDHKLIALASGNFGFNSTANPAIAIGTGATSGPNAIAFDEDGNLWATDSDAPSVIMFTPE